LKRRGRPSPVAFSNRAGGRTASARLRVLWLRAPVLRGCCSIPAAASTPDAAECGSAGPAPDVRVGRRRHAVRPAVRAPLTLWVHARPRAPPLLFSGRGVPRGHRCTHRAAGCREAETCLWGPWGPTWTCQGSSWWLAKGVRGGTAMVSLCDWDIGLAGNEASSPPAQRSPVFIEVPSFLAVYSRIVVYATTREPEPGRAVPSISYAVLADQVGSEPVPVGR